jgi:hypothetical protein
MHRPRHAQVILKLKLAALLLCVNRLLILAAIVTAIMSVMSGEVRYSKIALVAGASAGVLTVLQWIFASGGKCPLCTMPVLSRRGCSRHRNARCVAGSHRMPVAFGVLFRGHFRCPYCNEPTLLALRDTPRRQ